MIQRVIRAYLQKKSDLHHDFTREVAKRSLFNSEDGAVDRLLEMIEDEQVSLQEAQGLASDLAVKFPRTALMLYTMGRLIPRDIARGHFSQALSSYPPEALKAALHVAHSDLGFSKGELEALIDGYLPEDRKEKALSFIQHFRN